MSPGSKKSAIPVLLLSGILFFGSVQYGIQRRFEVTYPKIRIEKLLYLPAGEHLKIFSLGFQNLVADVLWMKAIGYFGSHRASDREYPWLLHILNQITTLDPFFRHPYLFGGIVLSVEAGSPEEAITLLRKAMVQYPGDWRFPFYIGFNYFYYLKDAHMASQYIHLAASIPGHPVYLPRLAASLLTRTGRLQAAIDFLTTMAEEAEEKYIRDSFLQKIEMLRSGQTPKGLETFISGEE